jgi:nucleoside-diphosphate-sugar epimerase
MSYGGNTGRFMTKKKTTLLITGATGFIGYAAVQFFARLSEYEVIAAVRKKPKDLLFPLQVKIIEDLDINHESGWNQAMEEVDCVLHCAARYHIPKTPFLDILAMCRKINVDGSLMVAKAALRNGVKRFIFVSTLKVHGEENIAGVPFQESDQLRPQYAYGVSKMEAELALKVLCDSQSMELVIIRPPPVYGDRVPANFLLMLKCIDLGLPLPIKSAMNLRSYVAVENLLELIRLCITHPAAVGQTFLAGDDRDWNLVDLIKTLAFAMQKSPLMLSVSPGILRPLASLVGKGPVIDILFLPSVVSSTKARKLLGWQPIVRSEDALINTAKNYLISKK